MSTHLIFDTIYQHYGFRRYIISCATTAAIFVAWMLSYTIMSSVIFIAAIVKLMLSLLTSHHYVPGTTVISTPEQNTWIETIISLSIQAFHETISLTWIIDREEKLHEFLHAEISLHVYIVPKLSTLIFNIIDNTTKTSTLWVNQQGYIIGINPCEGASKEPPSLSNIITWTKQNGAIMVQSYAHKRTYTIAHKGMVRENLSSHHAYNMLKQILVPQQAIHSQELV